MRKSEEARKPNGVRTPVSPRGFSPGVNWYQFKSAFPRLSVG